MVCRLIDFALVALKLLMFKVDEIISIPKIEFFNFPGGGRVNRTAHWLIFFVYILIVSDVSAAFSFKFKDSSKRGINIS